MPSIQTPEKEPNTQPFFGITHCEMLGANLNVLGICWDRSSTYRRGAREAPQIIRAATSGQLYNSFTEKMINLKEKWAIYDAGDIAPGVQELDSVYKKLWEICRKTPRDGRKYLFLGGDHLITFLCIKALVQDSNERWGLLYLDSHPDLYESYEGNRYSHACVVRRILDEGIIPSTSVLEVGIRAPTPEQVTYAHNNNLIMIPTSTIFVKGAQNIAKDIVEHFSNNADKIYLSIDLDVLDPAFAPGVQNPEPGGISTRALVDVIKTLRPLNIQAFDIVELCPPYDCSGITAFTAAKIIRETLGILSDA